jgi:hypothetical protein
MDFKVMVAYRVGGSGSYPPSVTSQLLEFHSYEQAEAAIKAIDDSLRANGVTVIRFYKTKKS